MARTASSSSWSSRSRVTRSRSSSRRRRWPRPARAGSTPASPQSAARPRPTGRRPGRRSGGRRGTWRTAGWPRAGLPVVVGEARARRRRPPDRRRRAWWRGDRARRGHRPSLHESGSSGERSSVRSPPWPTRSPSWTRSPTCRSPATRRASACWPSSTATATACTGAAVGCPTARTAATTCRSWVSHAGRGEADDAAASTIRRSRCERAERVADAGRTRWIARGSSSDSVEGAATSSSSRLTPTWWTRAKLAARRRARQHRGRRRARASTRAGCSDLDVSCGARRGSGERRTLARPGRAPMDRRVAVEPRRSCGASPPSVGGGPPSRTAPASTMSPCEFGRCDRPRQRRCTGRGRCAIRRATGSAAVGHVDRLPLATGPGSAGVPPAALGRRSFHVLRVAPDTRA